MADPTTADTSVGVHQWIQSGVAGLLYVTTGVHGGHVLLGMLLILLYAAQAHTYATYSAAATDTVHGLLGIVLYWHFVDVV